MAERSSLVRLQAEYDIELDWRPFELRPDTPLGGIALERLFPGVAKSKQDHLRRFAEQVGVDGMVLNDFVPNTRPVMAMCEWARERNALEPLRNAAMDAYWLRGENLGDESVLRRLAQGAGLNVEEAVAAARSPAWLDRVLARREEGEALGLTGVPFFVVPPYAFAGAQPYEVFEELMRRTGTPRRAGAGALRSS